MKKPLALLNTPARAVIAVGMIIIVFELLIMMVIEDVFPLSMHKLLYLFDPILLIAIVSPTLYFLILRPMLAQQFKLEQQLDEVRRIQRLSIGRELRMKELVEEIATLRHPLAVKPANNAQLTSDSLEAPRHAAEPHITTQTIEESQRNALLFMLEDLDAARKKIEHSHQEWMGALDVVSDPIFLHDKEFRILRCNKAYQQCAGIPFKQIIGQPYYAVFPKTGAPLPSCLREMEQAKENGEEEEVLAGEAIYRARAFSIHDKQGAYLYSAHTLEDITERKRAEAALREIERGKSELLEKLNESQQLALIGSWEWDLRTNHVWWSDETYRIFGVTQQDFVPSFEANGKFVHPDDFASYGKLFEHSLQTGEPLDVDLRLITNDGRLKYGHGMGRVVFDTFGKAVRFIGTFMDITERKQAEDEIQHANRALATLGAVNRNLVHATNEDELLQAVCQAIVEQRGYLMAWVGYVQHDESKSIKIMARAGHDEGYLDAMHLTWAETGRGIRPCGRAIRSGTTQLCQDIAHDSLYLPWRDEALKNSYAASIAMPLLNADNTVFGTLAVYSNEVNAFSPAEVSLLEEMAGDLAFGVRSLHIRHERDLALVKNQEQLVQLVFQNEEKEKRAAELAIANKELIFQNEEKEKRAAELAIANKELIFQNEEKEKRAAELIIANKELVFQNEEKEKRAAELAIANKELIFQNEEKEKRAAELIIANKELAFQNKEKETRAAELTIANKELEDSLEDTVRAIATIGEMRDPYTAGHQVRVADLAAAIAKQLGLPDEQVHAIHLAGVVHDLGKIKIPAEILSKPGKITDIEYSLIKVHPQAGYDILKGINFPWPIAQMVLQHHERLDGSGYPQGLKGEAILLEARILSVADVVEAMSSHRPYRPGLGIEVALAEITKQCGVYYDLQVVDACLTLFREQSYTFKN